MSHQIFVSNSLYYCYIYLHSWYVHHHFLSESLKRIKESWNKLTFRICVNTRKPYFLQIKIQKNWSSSRWKFVIKNKRNSKYIWILTISVNKTVNIQKLLRYSKIFNLDWTYIDIAKDQFFEIDGLFVNKSLFSRE